MKNIINEEIIKLIEGQVYSDERFTFKERLNNSTFSNYQSFTNEYDVNITESDIIINWKLSFWLNDIGIENLIVDIQGVEGIFNIEMYDLQTDELMQENQKNIQDFDWKFVVNDVILMKGGSLYVTELSFDFNTNVCNVLFN